VDNEKKGIDTVERFQGILRPTCGSGTTHEKVEAKKASKLAWGRGEGVICCENGRTGDAPGKIEPQLKKKGIGTTGFPSGPRGLQRHFEEIGRLYVSIKGI